MVVGIIMLLLIALYLIWVACLKSRRRKYLEAVERWKNSKEYCEWSKAHYGDICDFLKKEKQVEYVNNSPEYFSGHITAFTVVFIIGIAAWFGTCIRNTRLCEEYKQKAVTYQQFVDNKDDNRIANGGYDKVLEFNDNVITERICQKNWYYRLYHMFGDDWNEVPLIVLE